MQKEIPEIDIQAVSYFYSPVGLELGSESPEEIALSIGAEIIACFRNKSGKSLKYKEGTIHERNQ
jgi:xanthine/CO dehydrogenase XdhC/CoxF family maturation factor